MKLKILSESHLFTSKIFVLIFHWEIRARGVNGSLHALMVKYTIAQATTRVLHSCYIEFNSPFSWIPSDTHPVRQGEPLFLWAFRGDRKRSNGGPKYLSPKSDAEKQIVAWRTQKFCKKPGQFHYFSSSNSGSVRGNVAIREAFSWRCDSMLGQFDEKSVMPKSPRALFPRALRTISWLLFLESAEASASSYSRGKHEAFRHEDHQSIWPYSAISTREYAHGTV